ncbi:hypothetical protein LMG23992_03094 [Cupriavidus laharis]|uniref:Phage holin family protein n=1 Tax=Cupriavidus laharis TaxID=151654 RepID=A0ABM8X7V6_9BURK|nr:hypothetical protein [Cupriavidus laharis]CAG9176066.1 hypothetical protein LMG23992_03094 [Cupriavidus laharis]
MGGKPSVPSIPAIVLGQPVASTEDAPARTLNERQADEPIVREFVQDSQANRLLRADYADKAYCLAQACIAFWIVAIATVAAVKGFFDKQILSDTVLVAVTTGATINVLAAFLGVIRGLFPSNQKDDKKPAK